MDNYQSELLILKNNSETLTDVGIKLGLG